MAFVRVNGGGWSVGAQLTSAQQNQLDIDHANALDKTLAGGDTLSGHITMAASAVLDAGFAGNVAGSAAESIVGSVAGAIASTAVGGFALRGGSTDWPTFGPSITRSRVVFAPPCLLGSLPSGWSGGVNLTGPGTNSPIALLLPVLHNGATLSSVQVSMQVLGTHSALPANPPTLQLKRIFILSGGTGTPDDLSTTPIQQMPTSNVTAYDSSNHTQGWTYTANINNTIDTAEFMYYAILNDEHGANAINNNQYFGFALFYTNIADMRFP